MLACISTKAATEHAHEKQPRGSTRIQAVQEGRQTREHGTHGSEQTGDSHDTSEWNKVSIPPKC